MQRTIKVQKVSVRTITAKTGKNYPVADIEGEDGRYSTLNPSEEIKNAKQGTSIEVECTEKPEYKGEKQFKIDKIISITASPRQTEASHADDVAVTKPDMKVIKSKVASRLDIAYKIVNEKTGIPIDQINPDSILLNETQRQLISQEWLELGYEDRK